MEKTVEQIVEELKSGQRTLNRSLVDLRENHLVPLAEKVTALSEKVDEFLKTNEYRGLTGHGLS